MLTTQLGGLMLVVLVCGWLARRIHLMRRDQRFWLTLPEGTDSPHWRRPLIYIWWLLTGLWPERRLQPEAESMPLGFRLGNL